MVSRSVAKVCRRPVRSDTGPSPARRYSNARGQSSSVPSSSPTRCLSSPFTMPPVACRASSQLDAKPYPADHPARRPTPAATYDRSVVLVLAVSDEVDDALLADPHAVRAAELIVACGDLPFEYLGRLMNMLNVPLVFVPGNHDPDISGYRTSRAGLPLRAGLRAAGLGGCRRYSDGPNQYTEWQQARRARALTWRARWRGFRDGRSVDVLLTHAPPVGAGEGDDPPH